MNYNHFSNLSCYEEFEIQCTLAGVSKIDVLKKHAHKIDNYYFFIFGDDTFNWYDLEGNYVKDPGLLKEIKEEHIPLSISKCIIPDSVISIGNGAFFCCESLTSITIPNSVTIIGDGALAHCISLTSITIPNGVTNIGDYALSFCKSLTSITIPNNVTNVGYHAFAYCNSLKEVIFKGKTLEEVKQMKNYPFGIEDENVFKFS